MPLKRPRGRFAHSDAGAELCDLAFVDRHNRNHQSYPGSPLCVQLSLGSDEVEALTQSHFSSDAQPADLICQREKPGGGLLGFVKGFLTPMEGIEEGSPVGSRRTATGSPANSVGSSGAGKEGSLKHRILSRPGRGEGSQAVSEQNTPVPSPNSSDNPNPSSSATMPAKKRARISDRNSDTSSLSSHTPQSDGSASVPNSRSNSGTTTPCPSPGPPIVAVRSVIREELRLARDGREEPKKEEPSKFSQGSLIRLANGELKAVEQMSVEDFVQSAAVSGNLKVDYSGVARIERPSQAGIVVYFSVANRSPEVAVEASVDHPFFVLNKGWASASPADTLAHFGLSAAQMAPGDTCISLSCKESQPGLGARPLAPSVIRPTNENERDRNGPNSLQSASVVRSNSNELQGNVPFPLHINGHPVMLTGSELASFRRWSAPEDDRFLETYLHKPA